MCSFPILDLQSAYYVDSKTGAPDSERAFARLLRATLNEQVAKISLIGDKLSSSDSETIRAAVTKALKRDEVEMGLEVTQVEIRMFPSTLFISCISNITTAESYT